MRKRLYKWLKLLNILSEYKSFYILIYKYDGPGYVKVSLSDYYDR